MKRHLRVLPDTSLFYSSNQKITTGPRSEQQAQAWARGNHPTYKILKDMWTDSRYLRPWMKTDKVKDFFDVASKAMAELSSGTVYIFMGGAWSQADGKDWYDQSVWARIEWPALQTNHNVHTVYRVNSDTGATIKIKG
ncbi:hypothetical protein CPC08DRAFT_714662 [Agrocybe pediades]|nr:hypothetical protein CPC08DRAFT_714662 [Agrocybe pediades]